MRIADAVLRLGNGHPLLRGVLKVVLAPSCQAWLRRSVQSRSRLAARGFLTDFRLARGRPGPDLDPRFLPFRSRLPLADSGVFTAQATA
jgi:hypothetical protein